MQPLTKEAKTLKILAKYCFYDIMTIPAYIPMNVVQKSLSTQTNSITNRVIKRNLEIRQCDGGRRPALPGACLLSCVAAKRRHVYKYGDFYLQRGFDVLNVRVHIDHVLYAARAQSCVQQARNYLSHRAATVGPTPLLVHAFSTGGYLYGDMLIKMAADAERYGGIAGSISGEIFDSVVFLEGMPTTASLTVTNNRRLQTLIRTSTEQYLKLTHEHTTK
ncbi:PREDICTED: uncharacterized protein LOC106815083 [Priapulus caudatus]|uniref:Uncharacterized protein LOC106815083 n=1 Tax=Priapulus caudatus TaxID=37621 RepID=A0ABM1ES22_PRICU|nr:PREDICTED: uncharacterized protein LOC106815083 [Priapulus caudatus]